MADIFCLSVGTSGSQAYQLLQSNGATLVVESVDVGAIGGGITQLTGDVLAGPGGGSQAATVVEASGSIAGVLNLAGAGSSASTVNLGTASGVSAVNIGTSAGGAGIIIGAADASIELPSLAGAGTRMVVASAAGVLSTEAIVSGGITQLTGDVVAGPGSGSVAATVDKISGNTGGVVPITSPISIGATPATSGAINLASGAAIYWRNAISADPDLQVLDTDDENNVNLGTDGNVSNVFVGGASTGNVQIGGVNTSTVDIGIGAGTTTINVGGSATSINIGTTADVVVTIGSSAAAIEAIGTTIVLSTNVLDVGTAGVAASGLIRVPNATTLSARNAAGSADLILVGSDGSNNVNVATDNNSLGLNLGTGTGVETIDIGTGGAEGANNINIGGSGTTNKVAALSGTGTRIVTATSTGVLGTGAAPSSLAQVLYSLTGNPAVQVVSTAAETTLFSFVLPGNTLPTNGEIRCHLRGRIFNNVGTEGQTFRFYFGASVVLFFTLTNGASSTNSVAEDFEFTIVGAGATNAQYFNCTYLSNNGDTDGTANSFSGATSNCGTGQATGTLDTTSNQTIKATCQNAVSNANLYFSLYSAKLILV